jgi:cysteine-rich repeat protein
MLASCGDGATQPGEICDDGNDVDTDSCPSTCQAATCGDGFVQAKVEECDDAGQSAACDADCTAASCGDGQHNPVAGEECDDGNGSNEDACPGCQNAECGDGFIHSGVEQCDDGNASSGDGCSSSCTPEFPNVCDGGNDVGTGAAWVVCAADADSAWISANTGGSYHHVLICQSLGYNGVGQIGGTCGNVCGYCEGPTSCAATGSQYFDGGGACGSDGLGELLCFTVMWTCVN